MGLLLTFAFITGCHDQSIFLPAANYYYLNPNADLRMVGRVAVVELDNDSSRTRASSDITEELFRALQKEQIFGLTIVRQDDPSWRSLQLEADSAYNDEQISSIRETLKCDAVLVGSVTEFRGYPHMTVGLRLKLLDLKSGKLLWALEQIWDISDKQTEARIKRYYKSEKTAGSGALEQRLASLSPLEFIRFVCYEVGETL